MKRIVTIGVILAAVIGFSLWGVYKIHVSVEEISAGLESVSQQIEKGEYENAVKVTRVLEEKWKDSGRIFGAYLKHELTDQVGKNLTRLSVCLEEEERLESLATISEIGYDLRRIYENELPLMKNIF